ncbi:hypothetical protein Tco_0332184 [Tanacetum coccineum]
MGMDWLSKRKFVIVCHEKVVRIPLEGDGILQVQGERTLGAANSPMNAKLMEPRIMRNTRSRMVGSVMDEAHASSKEWNSGDDQLILRWMIYLVVLADAAESVKDAIKFEYCLASLIGWTNIRCAPFEALYGRKCRSPVLWAEIGESSLTGLKWGESLLFKGDAWKGVVHFGKDRVEGYEVLISVHDTLHVSNLKKCLADANLHLPLDEIKVDKTLRFVEEPSACES